MDTLYVLPWMIAKRALTNFWGSYLVFSVIEYIFWHVVKRMSFAEWMRMISLQWTKLTKSSIWQCAGITILQLTGKEWRGWNAERNPCVRLEEHVMYEKIKVLINCRLGIVSILLLVNDTPSRYNIWTYYFFTVDHNPSENGVFWLYMTQKVIVSSLLCPFAR